MADYIATQTQLDDLGGLIAQVPDLSALGYDANIPLDEETADLVFQSAKSSLSEAILLIVKIRAVQDKLSEITEGEHPTKPPVNP